MGFLGGVLYALNALTSIFGKLKKIMSFLLKFVYHGLKYTCNYKFVVMNLQFRTFKIYKL